MTARGPWTDSTGVPCQRFVELVSDYLEGDLDTETAAAVEYHLGLCTSCAEYLEQIKQTLRSLGHVPVDTLSQQAQDEIVAAFTGFHAPRA